MGFLVCFPRCSVFHLSCVSRAHLCCRCVAKWMDLLVLRGRLRTRALPARVVCPLLFVDV